LVEVMLIGVPEGAEVTFDGQPVEANLLLAEQGRSGQLEVRAGGFRDLRREVTFAEAQTIDLGDLLEPLPTPPEAPRSVKGASRLVPPETDRALQPAPVTPPASVGRTRVVGGYEESGSTRVQGGYSEGE